MARTSRTGNVSLFPLKYWHGSKKLRVAGLCFSLLMMGKLAMAQLPTGTFLGTVKDSTGAIVPGVTITAKHLETGLTRTALSSGEDGSYRLPALPVGAYEVRAEQPGFRAEVRSGLTLTVSEEAVVNFALQPGAVDETLVVTEEARVVNTTSGQDKSVLGNAAAQSPSAVSPELQGWLISNRKPDKSERMSVFVPGA